MTPADIDRAIARKDFPAIARTFDKLVVQPTLKGEEVDLLERVCRSLVNLYDPNWPVDSWMGIDAFNALQGMSRTVPFGRQHDRAARFVLDHLDQFRNRTDPYLVGDE